MVWTADYLKFYSVYSIDRTFNYRHFLSKKGNKEWKIWATNERSKEITRHSIFDKKLSNMETHWFFQGIGLDNIKMEKERKKKSDKKEERKKRDEIESSRKTNLGEKVQST